MKSFTAICALASLASVEGARTELFNKDGGLLVEYDYTVDGDDLQVCIYATIQW